MMPDLFSRRDFVAGLSGLGLASTLMFTGSRSVASAQTPAAGSGGPWAGFPRQDAKLVKEIVGAAHVNEARVRELVELKPQLVNAWWDWGFGDWESPLGAAAHTEQRTIAEFLISHGARIDIFAAAMLGMTEVVKAFVTASPGVQRTYGPHGITLLAHAQAGGEPASETMRYLESLGDAGVPLPSMEVEETDRQVILGHYRFGPEASDVFEVKYEKSQLTIERRDETSRRLFLVGKDGFFPSGAPGVRIRFEIKEGKAVSLTVVEREPVLTAQRVS